MRRVLTVLVALALLVGPIGAVAHALERDTFALGDVGVATPLPTEDARRHCCQSFIHTAKSACHFDNGLIRMPVTKEPRQAVGVTFETTSFVPTGFNPSDLLDPPRPV